MRLFKSGWLLLVEVGRFAGGTVWPADAPIRLPPIRTIGDPSEIYLA